MISFKKLIFCFLIVFSISLQHSLCETKKFDKNINTFINLIDYIIVDYHNAVEDGKVINKDEFAEMNEFIDNSIQLFQGISAAIPNENKTQISKQLTLLKKSIQDKASDYKIKEIAQSVKKDILSLNLVSLSPDFAYSLNEGEKLYLANCTLCHNKNGDSNTDFAKTSNPKPANLLDAKLMSTISVFHIYNTIRLGIAGTNMLPFEKLTEKEVWNLAFYVSALRFQSAKGDKELIKIQNDINNKLSIEEKSILSEDSLLKILNSKGIKSENSLAALRLFSPKEATNTEGILATNTKLIKVIELVNNKQYEQANALAIAIYLSNIEPYEKKLAELDNELKLSIESAMIQLRSDLRAEKDIEIINKDLNNIEYLLIKANKMLVTTKYDNWLAFLLSFSLIIREGIEALLIIVTIITVLNKLDSEWAIKWIHFGWILAVGIGIISMFFIDSIKLISGENREIFEAMASIFSVAMLLYVGLWLHSKSDAKAWKLFVENKVSKILISRSLIGLTLLSFIVVFREVFESTLFLTTLQLDLDNNSSIFVYSGASTAILTTILISWLLLKSTRNLPISKFFQISSFVIVILSVILIGKSVSALQEAGVMSISSFPVSFNISLLGLYSNYEAIASQLILICIISVLWKMNLAK